MEMTSKVIKINSSVRKEPEPLEPALQVRPFPDYRRVDKSQG